MVRYLKSAFLACLTIVLLVCGFPSDGWVARYFSFANRDFRDQAGADTFRTEVVITVKVKVKPNQSAIPLKDFFFQIYENGEKQDLVAWRELPSEGKDHNFKRYELYYIAFGLIEDMTRRKIQIKVWNKTGKKMTSRILAKKLFS